MKGKNATVKEVLKHLYQQIKKTRQDTIETKKELRDEVQKLKKELRDDMKMMKEETVKTRKKLQDDMHDYVKQRYRWLETKIEAMKK